jgi:hypothetical protein
MANTFKFSTLVWLILGLLVPLWPISLPVCWYLAYRSYKNGKDAAPGMGDLQAAIELNKSGNLSDEELQKFRARVVK